MDSYKEKPDFKQHEKFYSQVTLFKTQYQKLPNGETVGYRQSGADTAEKVILLLHGNFTCSTSVERVMKQLTE